MLCKFHRTRSRADAKRGTGYCTKKNINLLSNDCEGCNEREIFDFFKSMTKKINGVD